jgi:hypothetical protein
MLDLSFAPGPESHDARCTVALTNLAANLRRFAGNLAFNVVQYTDPIECFLGDWRLRGLPEIMEIATQVRLILSSR